MQAPGDVSSGALQVFQALGPAVLLGVLNEGMVRSTHSLQEQVVPVQELAVLLQEVHGNGQHPSQHVCKAVPQLQQHTQSWYYC